MNARCPFLRLVPIEAIPRVVCAVSGGARRRSRSDGSVWGSGSPRRFALDAAQTTFDASAEGQAEHPGMAGWLADHYLVLRYDLHGAVVQDVHDSAAHHLAVRQRDEDLLARTPLACRLVHDGQHAPGRAARLCPDTP